MKDRKALVIGGGAPNYTLMTGALLAFEEAGVSFDVISMAGGGAVVGLTYLAPKGFNRKEAMLNSINLGISDQIYRFLPMNYKVFTKPGPAAAIYRKMLSMMPGYERIVNQFGMTPSEKLMSDWIQAIWAIMSPSNLTRHSKGMCAHAPFIMQLVDFEALKKVREDFYLNAYCLSDHKMAIFDRDEVNPAHFKASLSYPFFYAPFKLNNKLYIEGAARDTFNFKALVEREPNVKTIVVFDAMGIDGLLQPPGDLWDAFGQSIITPLVALARADLKLFELVHNKDCRLLKVQFNIPPELLPTAMYWSSSNLADLFDVGYEAGWKFVERHGVNLEHD